MKLVMASLMILLSVGCVHIGGSITVTDPKTGVVCRQRFEASGFADSTLTAARIHVGQTTNNGIYIGGLSEQSNTTNWPAILGAAGSILQSIAAGAASGAK